MSSSLLVTMRRSSPNQQAAHQFLCSLAMPSQCGFAAVAEDTTTMSARALARATHIRVVGIEANEPVHTLGRFPGDAERVDQKHR
jgi:hypothetical protein